MPQFFALKLNPPGSSPLVPTVTPLCGTSFTLFAGETLALLILADPPGGMTVPQITSVEILDGKDSVCLLALATGQQMPAGIQFSALSFRNAGHQAAAGNYTLRLGGTIDDGALGQLEWSAAVALELATETRIGSEPTCPAMAGGSTPGDVPFPLQIRLALEGGEVVASSSASQVDLAKTEPLSLSLQGDAEAAMSLPSFTSVKVYDVLLGVLDLLRAHFSVVAGGLPAGLTLASISFRNATDLAVERTYRLTFEGTVQVGEIPQPWHFDPELTLKTSTIESPPSDDEARPAGPLVAAGKEVRA